jgi:hypothetical protein
MNAAAQVFARAVQVLAAQQSTAEAGAAEPAQNPIGGTALPTAIGA